MLTLTASDITAALLLLTQDLCPSPGENLLAFSCQLTPRASPGAKEEEAAAFPFLGCTCRGQLSPPPHLGVAGTWAGDGGPAGGGRSRGDG